MIASAIDNIVSHLETFFSSHYQGSAPKVIASQLSGQDSDFALETSEKQIIVTLANVEEYSYTSSFDYNNQPLHIKLTILISVLAESDYSESLGYLSSILQFFQSEKVFDHSNTPQLHDNIEKLEFKVSNRGFQEISGLWSMMGVKYMPSVILEAKTITYTSESLNAVGRI